MSKECFIFEQYFNLYMMKYIVTGLFMFIIALTFINCKKQNNVVETKTIDSLSFSQSEKDSIMNQPDSIPMRIYLTINYSDSLVLRKRCVSVRPDSNDIVLKTLVKRLKLALTSTTGVGIAAPQVGINRRIIWVKRLDKTGKPYELYLNPKIVMTSQNTVLFNGDGCLSIPNQSGRTLRWAAVGIEYDLMDGTHHTEVVQGTSYSNFTAVIFQHEIDHLSGILFIDRIAK